MLVYPLGPEGQHSTDRKLAEHDEPKTEGAGSPSKGADEYSLAAVFSRTHHKDPVGHETLGDVYKGVWDVIRYSAHQFDTKSPSDESSKPWVVRAAVEIGPTDPGQGRMEPWSRIHYKPRKVADLRISTGSIILINNGTHFCITGVEHDTNAPICVIAQFFRTQLNFFAGLVVRRHSEGRFLASRVAFVRSKAARIEDLTSKIDVYLETELRRRFSRDIHNLDFCLDRANSKVPIDGKCVLLL